MSGANARSGSQTASVPNQSSTKRMVRGESGMSRSNWFVVWLALVVLVPQLLSAQVAAPPDNGSASQEPQLVLPVRSLSTEKVTPPPVLKPLVISGNPNQEVVEVVQDEHLEGFQVQEAVPGELPPPADDPATATDILLPGAVDAGAVVEAPEVVVFPDGEVDPEALATGEDIELDDLPLPPEVILYTPPTPEEMEPVYPPMPETFPLAELPAELGQPPVLDPVDSQVIDEGNTLTFVLSARDPDPGQTVAIYTSELPLGATFAGNTFSWAPAFSQAGTYKVAFAAQDSGTLPLLSAQQTITITVNNVNLPPEVLAGEDQTVYVGDTVTLDGSASYDPDGSTLSYTWQPLKVPGFTDNNDGTASFAPSAPGVYTFTLEVDDSQGGITSDEVVVTVPNRPPVAVAGDDQTARVGETVTLDGSASYDPDGSAGPQPLPKDGMEKTLSLGKDQPSSASALTYTWTQTGGPGVQLSPVKEELSSLKTFPQVSFPVAVAGTYTFTLVVEDGQGGSDSDEVVVSVPNRLPRADAGPDQTVEATGPGATLVALDGSASSDPDGDALTYTWAEGPHPLATGAVAQVGLRLGKHTLTLSVEDGQGGSASDAVLVEVVDTTPPTLALNGEAALTVECHASFTDPGASAVDGVDGEVAVTVGGSVDLTAVGSYTLTYTAADQAGNSVSASRTVTVEDTTPPTLALNGPSELTLECHVDTYTETATASDDCDPHPALVISGSVDINTVGTYTLTYTATDQAGNRAEATRTVHVSDTRGPQIALLGEAEVTVECHLGSYSEAGVNALDESDGDLSSQVVVSGALDLHTVGDYVLTYTVADQAGNQAATTRTVHVVDTVKPVVTLQGDAEVNAECRLAYTDAGATILDDCDPDPDLSVTSTVDTDQPGAYLVTYVATDASGNVSDPVVRTVRVVDTTPPAITLTGAASITLECPAPYVEPGVQVTDTCDPSPTLIVSGAVDSHTPDTYTLTYTATDASGNVSAPVTRTVITRDTVAPAIVLNGLASLRVVFQSAYVEAGVTLTDACDLHPVLVITGAVNTNAVGTYALSYQGRDASGNTSAAVTRTVEVYKTPTQLTGDLAAQINSLITSGAIPAGNGNAFNASLNAAITSLAANNTADAINQLNAFINKVQAQSGKKVTAAVASQLIAGARQIITQLGGVAKLAGRPAPTRFALNPNYPNPFNPSTTISYELVEAAQVRLTIYNVMGQQVRELVAGVQEAGSYAIAWDGSDGSGQRVASGLYLYRLQAGNQVGVQKMLFAK